MTVGGMACDKLVFGFFGTNAQGYTFSVFYVQDFSKYVLDTLCVLFVLSRKTAPKYHIYIYWYKTQCIGFIILSLLLWLKIIFLASMRFLHPITNQNWQGIFACDSNKIFTYCPRQQLFTERCSVFHITFKCPWFVNSILFIFGELFFTLKVFF